jgi:hypothetical protein
MTTQTTKKQTTTPPKQTRPGNPHHKRAQPTLMPLSMYRPLSYFNKHGAACLVGRGGYMR